MRFLFTFLSCILSGTLFGQYQNRSVSLTDRNDKTTSGFIRFYDWDKSPSYVEFGRDSLSAYTRIQAQDIQRLTIIDGPVYEGLYLKMPYYVKTPVKVGESIYERIDSTYYLSELLLDSQSIKLYRLFDASATARFVIAKYDSLALLHNITIPLIKGPTLYTYNDPAYRKQLRELLYECPTLRTDAVQYTESSIIKLLKAYLTFCRIDSKIYLEQKKWSKPIIGVGGFGSTWQTKYQRTVGYGLTVQILFPRQFHNVFALIDLGNVRQTTFTGDETVYQIGLYAGRYFGKKAIQAKLYTGLSTVLGLFDTGAGISYKKMLSAEVRYSPFMNKIYDSFLQVTPLINLRAVVPLSRLTN